MRVARSTIGSIAFAALALFACPAPPKNAPPTKIVAAAGSASSSQGACSDALPSGSPESWSACVAPGTCTFVRRACCFCGTPERCDVYAVSVAEATALETSICPESPNCPECDEDTNPWLHPFCVSGRCAPVDVRTDDISACASDDECVARTMDCCDDCEGVRPNIAMRKDRVAEFRAQICGKTKCAMCGKPPPLRRAACDPVRKHCVVAG
jgi:hypothetical protein